MELIRGDVSSNLGASLGNALLLDLKAMNLLSPSVDVQQILIDKSKLDREKDRMRVKSNEILKEGVQKLICIGVDGKVDKGTLVFKEVKDELGNIKLRKERSQEHHLTFTNEDASSGGTYLTHRIIPVKGATGAILAKEVASVLEEFNSIHTVKAVLLDNTNTNTGSEGGLVTHLEKIMKRKLHTIGCSLHQNELPFRAVFKHLDGCTKAPTTFSGPLGKLCERDYHEQPQVNFIKISGPLDEMHFPEKSLHDISSDQRLLLEYVLGISKGKVNATYASWKIGPLNHARWLTLAIRLMCLWTRGAYPPELHNKLYQIISFIVSVYAVSWFEIKSNSKFHNQQLHLFNMIQRIKEQSAEIQYIALNNLKYNAFALLPENMLYSMMKSEDVNVRKTALHKIICIR